MIDKIRNKLRKLYVEFRNSQHPGFSKCHRCGGNWGWKRGKTHMTGPSCGLFLFCEECDKVVTKEERWAALDEWKEKSIVQVYMNVNYTREQIENCIKEIKAREFIEFPRSNKEK